MEGITGEPALVPTLTLKLELQWLPRLPSALGLRPEYLNTRKKGFKIKKTIVLILDGIQTGVGDVTLREDFINLKIQKDETLLRVGQTFPVTLPLAIHLQYSKDSIHSNVDL